MFSVRKGIDHIAVPPGIGQPGELLPALDAELRAVDRAHRRLLPTRPLPRVHVVFGAGNSGGTAPDPSM